MYPPQPSDLYPTRTNTVPNSMTPAVNRSSLRFRRILHCLPTARDRSIDEYCTGRYVGLSESPRGRVIRPARVVAAGLSESTRVLAKSTYFFVAAGACVTFV